MNPLLKILIFVGILSSTIPNVIVSNNICSLCDNGIYLNENHTKLYEKETNILFESKNFYVAIDNYPVCDYHILIVPKEHKCSYSTVDIDLEYEFDSIIKTLSDILKTNEYGLFNTVAISW